MKRNFSGNIIIALSGMIFSFGLSSCIFDEITPANEIDNPEESADLLVNFPTRAGGIDNDPNAYLDPLNNYFVANDNNNVLLIAQRTGSHSISFDEESEENKPFLFKYVWDGKEAQMSPETPNWYEGYNFKPLESWGNPLNWNKVITNGQLGNSYAFGALYFPESTEQISAVSTNQSDLKELVKSNVLGTYHLTENMYERFRFRLYHIMACIRVTILVPEFRTVEGEGPTGFNESKIVGTLLNVQPYFTINWGDRSTEEPPIVTIQTDEQYEYRDITMYPHPLAEGEVRKIVNYDLTNFGLEGTDNVREYTFTVLFPTQTISSTANILRFSILGEDDSLEQGSYVWSTSSLMTNLQVSTGTVTNLILYLPRTANDAILVKSEIIDWNHADSNVVLTPEPSSEND